MAHRVYRTGDDASFEAYRCARIAHWDALARRMDTWRGLGGYYQDRLAQACRSLQSGGLGRCRVTVSTASNRKPDTGQVTAYILLGIFVIVRLGFNAYWIYSHKAPPTWDQAWYLGTSVNFYYALREGGLRAFADTFVRALGGIKAPLIALLPLPFYFLFWPGERIAMLTLMAMLVVFDICLFHLVKQHYSHWVALGATVITDTMPMVLNLSHQFLVEYGLATLVVIWVYILYKSEYYRLWRYNLLLGITLGFGLLMKVIFPLYIAGPALVIAVARVKRGYWQSVPPLILAGLLILGLGSLIASTWYAKNLHTVFEFAFSTSFGQIAHDYSLGDIFAWSTISTYWLAIVNQGISFYYILLFVILFLFLCVRRILAMAPLRISLNGWVYGSWFILPFIVATFGVNKDARFVMPAFAVIGVALALLYYQVLTTHWAIRLLPLILVWPLLMAIYFIIPAQKWDWGLRFQSFTLLASKHSQSIALPDTPRDEAWPVREILSFVNMDAQGQTVKVMIAVDHHYLNFSTLDFYRSLLRYPLQMDQIAYRPKEETLDQVFQVVEQNRYVLVKTGYQGPAFSNGRNADIRARLQASSRYRLLQVFVLPDNSTVEIYER